MHCLRQISPDAIGIENYSKYFRKYLRGIFLFLNIFAFDVFTFRWKSRGPDAIDQACSTSHGMEFLNWNLEFMKGLGFIRRLGSSSHARLDFNTMGSFDFKAGKRTRARRSGREWLWVNGYISLRR